MTYAQMRIVFGIGGVIVFIPLAMAVRDQLKFQQNLHKAENHYPIVKKKLADYPEFKDIRPSYTTAGWGALSVYGYVDNESQKARLKQIIAETNPPVNVLYDVRLREESATNQNKFSSD